MNTILFRRASVIFGLAAVSVVGGVSAQAQTVGNTTVSTSASALMAEPTDNLVAQTDSTVPSRPPGDTTPGMAHEVKLQIAAPRC